MIRAFRSRHPAAWMGILVGGMGPFGRAADRLIRHACPRGRKPAASAAGMVFIVCPPRSGGTLVYQALTRTLPSVYLSNAHALLPSVATALSRRLGRRFPREETLRNYYGYTAGLFDVYEGNEFLEWAHRLIRSSSRRPDPDVVRKRFMEMVALLAPLPGECVIFKNSRAYSIVSFLHEAVPEMLFVRVTRERSATIRSSLMGFYELGSFHPVPEPLKEIPVKDPLEFAFAQIQEIEARLDGQFAMLPVTSRFTIPYEQFCERPYHFISRIAYDYLGLEPGSVRVCRGLQGLRVSAKKRLPERESRRIEELLKAKTRPATVPGLSR